MANEQAITEVQMTDGRKVTFSGKRIMQKEVIIADGKVSVRFDFRNGETRTYAMPDQHLLYAAGHGLGQKLGDYTAGMKNEDGSPATVEDVVLATDECYSQISNGDWNQRSSGGGGFAGASILLRALAEFTGKGLDVLKTWLSAKTAAEKRALRNSNELLPIVQRLEAEKAKSAVDTGSLLGEIA